MEAFSYTAVNSAGTRVTGTLEAYDRARALRKLQSQGLTPTRLESLGLLAPMPTPVSGSPAQAEYPPSFANIQDFGALPVWKKRHWCLTGWLAIIVVANSLMAFNLLFRNENLRDALPSQLEWTLPALGLGAIVTVVSAIALFQWKKWGFYGFVASAVTAAIINFILDVEPGLVLLGLSSIGFLYGALRIGGPINGWDQLEGGWQILAPRSPRQIVPYDGTGQPPPDFIDASAYQPKLSPTGSYSLDPEPSGPPPLPAMHHPVDPRAFQSRLLPVKVCPKCSSKDIQVPCDKVLFVISIVGFLSWSTVSARILAGVIGEAIRDIVFILFIYAVYRTWPRPNQCKACKHKWAR